MYRIFITLIGICFINIGFSNVLIVNGLSNTSEPTTTANITSNLETLHMAVGNTTVTVDTLPADISSYNEIWDIRFSNTSPLSVVDIASYLTFLQRGGSLFLMGENAGFINRNNSILDFINQAGGGTLAFSVPNDVQDVLPPFNQPNGVNSFAYIAPGGVVDSGTGAWATQAQTGGGSAIYFETGTLANANRGTLTVVFDVNFMQGDPTSTDDNIQFFKNLINVVTSAAGSNSVSETRIAKIPTISVYSLLIMIMLLGVYGKNALKRNKNK